MKKKRIWIPLLIMVIVCLVFVLFFVMYRFSLGITVGRCLVADNGSYLLIDENSPIRMSNYSANNKLFEIVFLWHIGH